MYPGPMPKSLEGKLVVAISSRALFDFEEENRVFEEADDRAYMELQLSRLDMPAKPGVAFPLVKKLLAFNAGDQGRVAVVILSRNDPVSGLRVFRSAQESNLQLERGVFTRGRNPYPYLTSLGANLFLSAKEEDVRAALNAGFAAARVYPDSAVAADRRRMRLNSCSSWFSSSSDSPSSATKPVRAPVTPRSSSSSFS